MASADKGLEEIQEGELHRYSESVLKMDPTRSHCGKGKKEKSINQ